MNYKCYKAITHFRGREYIAWFTYDIPINQGPWKLHGLPGLILRVYDNEQKFCYNALSLLKTERPIYYLDENYKKTTRANIMKIDRHRHTDVVGFMNSQGIYHLYLGGQQNKPGEVVLPFIPMELD